MRALARPSCGVLNRQNHTAAHAPSLAPALLTFDRSTARSDGTDSAVLAIEKLEMSSAPSAGTGCKRRLLEASPTTGTRRSIHHHRRLPATDDV
ncbi:hypothetical protein DZD52_14615 [Xanthomonas nasturtii]|uniref:Uncharacterized protein n=1 Tax=Xanthomonas nasturtii TaxID=1843581 RepID=A0A3E1KIC6_9XANT|nr:hypothetical protein DZD52_14615 [Xanthomonas nasturtii]